MREATDILMETDAQERKEEKERWIDEHGSDYLKRLSRLELYCEKTYKAERAAIELNPHQWQKSHSVGGAICGKNYYLFNRESPEVFLDTLEYVRDSWPMATIGYDAETLSFHVVLSFEGSYYKWIGGEICGEERKGPLAENWEAALEGKE